MLILLQLDTILIIKIVPATKTLEAGDECGILATFKTVQNEEAT